MPELPGDRDPAIVSALRDRCRHHGSRDRSHDALRSLLRTLPRRPDLVTTDVDGEPIELYLVRSGD